MLHTTNEIANRYRIVFGEEKSNIISITHNFLISTEILEIVDVTIPCGNTAGVVSDDVSEELALQPWLF